jgi:hypothetical protein
MTDCPICGSLRSVDDSGYCNALGCNVRALVVGNDRPAAARNESLGTTAAPRGGGSWAEHGGPFHKKLV